MVSSYKRDVIVEKLKTLPNDLLAEVEDFIDFLKAKHAQKKSSYQQSDVTTMVNEPKSLYGSAKGLFVIPKDFNEPLDDFKDYM